MLYLSYLLKKLCFLMAVLDLRCCVRAFFSWGEWGPPPPLWCVHLLWWLLFWGAWAPGMQASVVVAHGLSCPVACGIFLDPRDWAPVSCIGRWSLNHWTTREVLSVLSLHGQSVTEQELQLVSPGPCPMVFPQKCYLILWNGRKKEALSRSLLIVTLFFQCNYIFGEKNDFF